MSTSAAFLESERGATAANLPIAAVVFFPRLKNERIAPATRSERSYSLCDFSEASVR
jgi:hypothetical protein